MVIQASNMVARLCDKLAKIFEELERRLNLCEDCGKSRFYGKSCLNPLDAA